MIILNLQLSMRDFRFFLYLSRKLKNDTYEEQNIFHAFIKQFFMVCL